MDPQLYDLIAKSLSGEASPAEEAALADALRSDGEAAEAFRAAQEVWQAAETVFPAKRFDTQAAWAKVSARIEAAATPPEEAVVRSKRIVLPVWTRWAAAAAVLAAGVFLFRSRNGGMEEIRAVGTQVVALSDGSKVTLHDGAVLKYPKAFRSGSARQVALEGRAFFEVTKNPAQPFMVDGGKVDVTVLGTSFEVDGDAARVAVMTGKVRVADHDDAAVSVIILPGEQATLRNDLLQKTVADNNDSHWKTGELAFNNQSFDRIITEISRILEVPVALDASVPAAVRTQSVTFSSRSATVEPVLDDLCRITGCRWERADSGYRILSRAR